MPFIDGIDPIGIESMDIDDMFIELFANPPQAMIADILSLAAAWTATKYEPSLFNGASRCAIDVELPCASTDNGAFA